MKNLKEVSLNYAMERSNELFSQLVAQAFADGYNKGYKDREKDISVDLRDGQTEYVDLGLPSGTLWSADYEKSEGEILFLQYDKAKEMAIPTEEEWNELLEHCRIQGDYSSTAITFSGLTCIGPNGNSIKFHSEGYMKDKTRVGNINYGGGKVYFWLHDKEETPEDEKKIVTIDGGRHRNPDIKLDQLFTGFKTPVRLVKHNK